MLADTLGNDWQINAFLVLDVEPAGWLVDQLFFGVTGHVGQRGIYIHHQTLLVGDQNGFSSGFEHPGENGLLLCGQSLLLQHAL